METLTLFDRAMGVARPEAEIVELAERLLELSLTQFHYLAELDHLLHSHQAALPGANIERDVRDLRRTYEQWSEEAGEILQRIGGLRLSGTNIRGFDELRDAHGRTLAMLSVSAMDVERGRQQIASGQSKSAEELRRELRPSPGR